MVHAERFSPSVNSQMGPRTECHRSEDKMLHAMKGLGELPHERIKYRMNSLLTSRQN